jgi:hypothetical protein
MDFIYTNPNSLSKEICEDIIELYERDKDYGYVGATGHGLDKKIKDSWDLSIHQMINNIDKKEWINIHKLLYTELYTNLKIYLNNLSNKNEYSKNRIDNCIKFNIIEANLLKAESFQIQKYEPLTGKYIYHQDGKTEIDQKRYRVITYLWYLNDVFEGGETEFWGTYKVKPEAGKLILFPATWSYPHCGNIPISNAKYIITGWLYADADM